ncbi:MAG: uracil-DNA glycosylase [Betaproteobacteria bacterium]
MNLPYSEDTLREMELWPFIELQRRTAHPAATVVASTAASTVATTVAVPAAKTNVAEPARRTAASAQPVRSAPSPRAAAPSALPAPDPARVARIGTLDWQGLKAEAAACQACGLCKQRRQAVLGVGAVEAPWLFVGEGPGAEEDEQGEPFVGQAGKLLDAMLAATGLQRGREVYIANVVKCRPPGNRNPSPEESLACAPLLDRQIDLIQPKLIVALGKIALTRLTGSEASMASMRGKQHEYRGIPVIATYHPAYLLRNLPDKLKAWEDLMFAKRVFVAKAG